MAVWTKPAQVCVDFEDVYKQAANMFVIEVKTSADPLSSKTAPRDFVVPRSYRPLGIFRVRILLAGYVYRQLPQSGL